MLAKLKKPKFSKTAIHCKTFLELGENINKTITITEAFE